mgnify:FL=1
MVSRDIKSNLVPMNKEKKYRMQNLHMAKLILVGSTIQENSFLKIAFEFIYS